MKFIVATAIAGLMAAPAFAEGDAGKGEKGFKKCKSCHMLVSDSGEEIVKGGRTGPNLYGLPGRTAGSLDGYKFSASLIEAGTAGLVWEESNFVAYTADPKTFLKEATGDTSAKSKMTFKLKKGAEDIWAYIASVSE